MNHAKGIFVFALLGLLAGACSDGPTPAGGPEFSPLRAEPDPVTGGRIVDREGREVLLRGVNVNSFVEYWEGNEFPATFPFTEADAERMSEIGWNAVRLLVSWSRIEPEPGVYDDAYLDEIEEAVAILARHGMYTIIDFHQDAWSATLAARPDEVCTEGWTPALGWDGAPEWATFDLDRPRCVLGGNRELSPAVMASWAAFFSNAEGPGGVGIRTRYASMVGHVAARFADDPAVAGFDIMNEPGAISAEEQEGLAALHAEALAAIRDAERSQGGFSHMVFFEPQGFRLEPPFDFARDDNVVYAPHIYEGGFTASPITREAFEVTLDEARLFDGAPVLSGEWGANADRAGPAGDGYFVDHQSLQDEFHFSATLWTWRESCGDPHKVRDVLGGGVPVPWGEFELDCSTNEILGERTALIDDLTWAYPRASPGRLVSTEYDPETGRLEVMGAEAPAGAELVVFYPAAKHGERAVRVSGLSAVESSPAPGGSVYLRARANGGDWTLTVD